MDTLIERLNFHNPWWLTGGVPEALNLPFHRKQFFSLKENLQLDRILVMKGPRRTGKTTIFYQLINDLLASGVKPTDILYLSFDDLDVRERVPEILTAWQQTTGKPLEKAPQRYFFLDEAQFLPNWETDVKLYHDRKYPIKFLISGSSASVIKQKSESLLGRTWEETLLPLDFEEFLTLKGDFYGLDQKTLAKPEAVNNKLLSAWEGYLNLGGFPGIYDLPVEKQKINLKDNMIDKAIYRDLAQIYGVREPEVLEKMLRYLAEISSGLVNISDLSSTFKLSWEATQNYLTYLQQAYLVFTLPKYSPSPKETARSLEKVHVIDTAIMGLFSLPEKGALWETAVARHFWSKGERETFFWRDKYEVDLVLEKPAGLLPMEIKSSKNIEEKDLRGLTEFMIKNRCPRGIIFYAGKENLRKTNAGDIKLEPVWKLGIKNFSVC